MTARSIGAIEDPIRVNITAGRDIDTHWRVFSMRTVTCQRNERGLQFSDVLIKGEKRQIKRQLQVKREPCAPHSLNGMGSSYGLVAFFMEVFEAIAFLTSASS